MTTTEITISSQAAAALADVLEQCEAFFTANQLARAELADFCLHQPPAVTSGWLLDMLGWHALHLRARVSDLDHTHTHTQEDR